MAFDLSAYETVAERLAKLYAAEPDARIHTEMLTQPGADICVFKACLWVGNNIVAIGHAEETRGAGNVNRTSHVENCETSAIGRALANWRLAGSDPTKRASREEMAKVGRGNSYIPANASGGNDDASPAQKAKLRALSAQTGSPLPDLDQISKREASRMIDEMLTKI